jgi:hypothetical protein
VIATVSGVQWTIGWIVAAAVVVVVVLVVGTIIYLAARIRTQLAEVLEALIAARDNTAALWEVRTTNEVAQDILDSAAKARAALGAER